ncbi:heme NO-binding domain-containing protein [Aquisalinus flavus]|uniref:Guanylate cyclase n=1 Tax=Aquisalinus flavus TaxID=1526572 RepID=A0A8J2V2X3_9PROT|nr:heme NO-binding domain-containing protein [Aquisalinus flavus]MBD0426688.1 heme NO-binding domain-containing protein [Aquisalinus flavus]UNE47774.1 hypothetical protein FF099_06770 [Aquisalinus flavus]GGD05828.1 guanylate cyclase [Aquisalinus flavus]
MKGVVFVELFEFVEQNYDVFFLQDLIEAADLPSGGVYTAVGTYPGCEMARLAAAFAQKTGLSVPEIMKKFGHHLFGRFVVNYPAFFEGGQDALSFLASIEGYIHREVYKLYPDAELPRFEIRDQTADGMALIYNSTRHLGDLCEGLILGCLDHFGEAFTLTRTTLRADDVSSIQFDLRRA